MTFGQGWMGAVVLGMLACGLMWAQEAFDPKSLTSDNLPKQVILKSDQAISLSSGSVTVEAGATVDVLGLSGDSITIGFAGGKKDVPFDQTNIADLVLASRAAKATADKQEAEKHAYHAIPYAVIDSWNIPPKGKGMAITVDSQYVNQEDFHRLYKTLQNDLAQYADGRVMILSSPAMWTLNRKIPQGLSDAEEISYENGFLGRFDKSAAGGTMEIHIQGVMRGAPNELIHFGADGHDLVGEGKAPESSNAAVQATQENMESFIKKLQAAGITNDSIKDVSFEYGRLVIKVANSWHFQPYQLRLQMAQNLWNIWASIDSPDAPDKALIRIVDLNGNEVGGSRIFGGSLIWVQKEQ